MRKYYYDLHIHSCLSPCGDNESTPNSIVGMGKLNGLDIMALTDHNTCKNCPAFFKAAFSYGILPVAGMELTTAEDIHIICLFPNLDNAMAFSNEIEKRRILIKNRTDIFGDQHIVDFQDNIIGTDEYLLSNATNVSLDEAPLLVKKFDGICYPAHIDRESNGIIAVLGSFPPSPVFCCAEVHNSEKSIEYSDISGIEKDKIIVSSDAHYLWDIKEKKEYFELEDIEPNSYNTGEYIINFLRGIL